LASIISNRSSSEEDFWQIIFLNQNQIKVLTNYSSQCVLKIFCRRML
jgi:hypothetical protein